MNSTNAPEPYLSPIGRTILVVLWASPDYSVVKSQTRAWLSRSGLFRGAAIPDGGFAEIAAHELIVPQIGGTGAFTVYRLSKRGREWVTQWRESTMAIYHKNPTVYQMGWNSSLRHLYANREPFYEIDGEPTDLNLFIHDDGGAWITAHTPAAIAGQVSKLAIFEYRTGAPVVFASLPQPAQAAVELFLAERGITYYEEVQHEGTDSTGQASRVEGRAKAHRP